MKNTHHPHLKAILLVIFYFILQASAESQGVFELRLKSFANKINKDSQGHCCDGYRTSSGRCSGVCSTKFRVCLKHFQLDIDPSHECTFGEHVTSPGEENRGNIIQFPLDFKWPGTFSLIIEAWHQNNKSEDGNTLISRMATQKKLNASSSGAWTHGRHAEGHTILEFEYRMICTAHYYGKDCDTLCKPRDDQFGHYTCGQDGHKICLQGWQKDMTNPEGDYCTKAVCLAGCHSEHGECNRPGECKCRDGWVGRLCNQCQLYPGCQHGSCSEPWQCNCHSGWGGLFCNQDLNYCTNNSPCRNGATCYNTGQGEYTCSCKPGWKGQNCEIRITNECSEHQPCLNGGTCQGSGIKDYKCVCPIGFQGPHCEKRAQTCSDDPCKNGATCSDNRKVSRPDKMNSIRYTCKCLPGFHGVNCGEKMDQCSFSPCTNGGTCYKDGNDGAYKCKCPEGFSGEHCEHNIDECAANPCINGGTCIDFVNDYKCRCLPGFTGTHCERNIDDCRNNPCANGGKCHDSVNDFFCICKPGFTGRDCSVESNECKSSPCMNGGICKDRFNDFECNCRPNYSGKYCEILPNGTVMKRKGEHDEDSTRKALIATFATIMPVLAVVACVTIMCRNRRNKSDQKKADAEAKRENELNAVTSVNKSKMLDDHMIVNQFECKSKTKRNVNEHQEEFFNSKDVGTYKQMVSPQYVPHSNVSSVGVVSKKLMNTDYNQQHSVTASSFEKLLNDSKDNFSSSGDTYSSNGTCVTSSSSATSSTTSSQYIPESSRSQYNFNLTANGRHTHVTEANASHFNDCASTVSSCSSDSHRGGATTGGASSLLNTSYNSNTSTKSKSKKHDLPTAASINSEAASARSRSSGLATSAYVTDNRAKQNDLRRSLHSQQQHNHFSDDLSTEDLYATEV